MVICLPFTVFGILVVVFPQLIMLMPIFRPNECLMVKIDNDYGVTLAQLNVNTYVFIIVNWLEVIYLYYIWKKLKRVEQDQLNIKNEFGWITTCWIVFSIIYFLSVTVLPLLIAAEMDKEQQAK